MSSRCNKLEIDGTTSSTLPTRFHVLSWKYLSGYVFNQVHNIQQNVPVENVEAMLQAAYDFG